jgi:hypothetical protein
MSDRDDGSVLNYANAGRRDRLHWTSVAAFSESISANCARQRLEEEEIPCFLDNENTVGTLWYYGNALGGIKLRVPDEYVAEARQVLGEHVEVEQSETEDQTPLLEDEHSIACPKCHSTDTTRFSWKLRIVQASVMLILTGTLFLVHPIVAVIGLALAVYFLMTKPDFRCTRCGHRWSL